MGSNMKISIFDERTARALKNWRMVVKKKHGGIGGKSPAQSVASSLTASPVHPKASTVYPTTTNAATLHRFKTTGHSTYSVPYEDTDASDIEAEPPSPESSTRHLFSKRVDYDSDNEIKLDVPTEQELETRHDGEFSFGKSGRPLE